MAGKKYKAALEQINQDKRYSTKDAAVLLDQMKISTKSDETVDIAVRLNVDPKHADQMVRGMVVLPHGTGKTKRVLAIVKADKVSEAEEAGADFAGGDEYINKIKDENWIDFDSVVATPDMMGKIGSVARILGPRGLMPNPKVGTVAMDVGRAVRELKAGRVEFRVEKSGIVHAPVGRVSFPAAHIQENIDALLEILLKLKPASAKGNYMKSITVSTTHGPGIRIDTQAAMSVAN